MTSFEILRQAAGYGVGEGGEELFLPAEDLPGEGDLLGSFRFVAASMSTIICLSSR